MERHDSTQVLAAVADGLRWHETNGSSFDDKAAREFLDKLHEAGLAVTERGRTIMEWSPWRLRGVTPGRVHVLPGHSTDHQVKAEAIAFLVQHPPLGQGAVIEREITVSASWDCDENTVDDATRRALGLALRQARMAADAFIAAVAEAEHEAA